MNKDLPPGSVNIWFDGQQTTSRNNAPARLESPPLLWANVALHEIAFKTGCPLKVVEGDGWLVSPFNELLHSLLALDDAHVISEKNANNDIVYNISYAEGLLKITFEDEEEISFSAIFLASSEDLFKKIYELCAASTAKTSNKSVVSMLARTQDGLELMTAGVGGIPIERDNYASGVIQGFDKVITELRESEPDGRLNILYGPPGTGKTFLLRGIIDAVREAKYIIIPPAMTQELMDPSIIPTLISEKRNYDGPIVLLLEDADSCLVRRGADNMSGIAGMLNFGDGIIGSVLDVRIVATTNAKKLEIDEALRRGGRLCAELHVDALSVEDANRILKRLVPDCDNSFIKPETLAGIYSKARQLGWKPSSAQKEEKKIKSTKYHGYL